jgi:tetratricopeptide (TPR) repeat protein
VCELADDERSFGLARRCKKEFEAAVALDPRHVDARWGLMEFNMQAPWIVGGSKDRARQLLAEIKQIDPVRGYFAEVRMNQMEKRQVSPEPLYQQALQKDSSSYRARMSLAEFYASDAQKKYEVSEKLAREAMQLRPGRVHAYSFLASLFAHLNRWQDLDALLAQADKNIPDNPAPCYSAARVLAMAGKELPRAERYLRKYLTMEPEGGAPTHAHAQWRLSLVLEKSGRKADAIAALETALRLKPDLEEAKKDLKRLKG